MQTFFLFWLDGKKEQVTGDTIADAYNRAGYSGGAMRALDFYSETDSHDWLLVDGEYEWVRKTEVPPVQDETIPSEESSSSPNTETLPFTINDVADDVSDILCGLMKIASGADDDEVNQILGTIINTFSKDNWGGYEGVMLTFAPECGLATVNGGILPIHPHSFDPEPDHWDTDDFAPLWENTTLTMAFQDTGNNAHFQMALTSTDPDTGSITCTYFNYSFEVQSS